MHGKHDDCDHSLVLWDSLRRQQILEITTSYRCRVVYRTEMYDFDRADLDARFVQGGFWRGLYEILRLRPRVIEINEPAMLKTWPSLIATVASVSLLRRFRGFRHLEVVTYCLANHDLVRATQSYLALPRLVASPLTTAVCRFVLSRCSKIGFGSDGSMASYRKIGALRSIKSETRVSTDLMAPCPCSSTDAAKNGVLFIGEFSERKGITQLRTLWEEVGANLRGVPGESLTITVAGKGPLESTVRSWAANDPSVNVVVDPGLDQIHRLQSAAAVVVLLSQSNPRWREQIGLPVTEALSHGCEVLTTDATGLASWLDEHGHLVVPEDFNAEEVAKLLISRARHPRSRGAIEQSLPPVASRVQCRDWMHSESTRHRLGPTDA